MSNVRRSFERGRRILPPTFILGDKNKVQSKYYANLSITLLTLGLVFYFQNIATVLSFGIAVVNLGFHSFLARAADVRTSEIQSHIDSMKKELEALTLSVGLRR